MIPTMAFSSKDIQLFKKMFDTQTKSFDAKLDAQTKTLTAELVAQIKIVIETAESAQNPN